MDRSISVTKSWPIRPSLDVTFAGAARASSNTSRETLLRNSSLRPFRLVDAEDAIALRLIKIPGTPSTRRCRHHTQICRRLRPRLVPAKLSFRRLLQCNMRAKPISPGAVAFRGRQKRGCLDDRSVCGHFLPKKEIAQPNGGRWAGAETQGSGGRAGDRDTYGAEPGALTGHLENGEVPHSCDWPHVAWRPTQLATMPSQGQSRQGDDEYFWSCRIE